MGGRWGRGGETHGDVPEVGDRVSVSEVAGGPGGSVRSGGCRRNPSGGEMWWYLLAGTERERGLG